MALAAFGLVALPLVAAAVGLVVRHAWPPDQIRAHVAAYRAALQDYNRAVDQAARATGAPPFYVRWVYPEPVYRAPCTEERHNPVRTLNAVFGWVGGTILTLIPWTAPAGAAVLAAAGAVQAASPATVLRPCR